MSPGCMRECAEANRRIARDDLVVGSVIPETPYPRTVSRRAVLPLVGTSSRAVRQAEIDRASSVGCLGIMMPLLSCVQADTDRPGIGMS